MIASRRSLIAVALAAAAAFGLAAGGPAAAQDYPSKPITMLVGYQAGGQTDLVARAAAKVMSDQLGQPINVVNKPGAGGAVAAMELKRAATDGYTTLFHANTVITSAPFIMARVDFKPEDFEYAGMITAYQSGLATQKDAPFDTLPEFVAWAKENPGFAYGSLSPESRMIIEQIAEKEGLDANIVPLKGGGDMINAVLGKQVVLALSGGIHKKYPDEMKMIVALTTFRHPTDPDIPTIDDEGYRLAMDTRTTVILPKGTPRPILDRLAAALKAAETDETFGQVVEAASIPIMYLGVDEANREMRDGYARNKEIMERVGIVPK